MNTMPTEKLPIKPTQALTELANKAVPQQTRDEFGRIVGTIPDEKWSEALERLASGEMESDVEKAVGVYRGSLKLKALKDERFAASYRLACGIRASGLLETALNIAQKGDLSCGDPVYDKMYLDLVKWMLPRVSRGEFGDHVQVDQQQVVIHVVKDDDDWT